MKKASRVLVLLLVAVLILGVFSSCSIFGRNTDKYRSMVAITVGDEKITIGKLIDTFNNFYNSNSGYIGQGITVDDIINATVSSLYNQYMKIDAYKHSGVQPVSHDWLTGVTLENAGYLTDSELKYAIKYIKYVLFTTLDGMVEGYVGSDYELNDAEEDSADTSRDFVEYDDLKDAATYSDYTYNQNFVNEDMDEYISKYYGTILTDDKINVEEYIYAASQKDSDVVKARLKELNDRIDDEDPITFEKYVEYQQQALTQYRKNVENNYKYDLETLIQRQMSDYIDSVIVAKYNYSKYSVIDNADGLTATLKTLKDNYQAALEAQKTDFNINNNFVSFVEGLTDSSYIYNVPEGYNYIFVKNILVPFNDEQKAVLSNLEKQLGSTDHPSYIEMRNKLASEIVADDFLSEKDKDGNYAKINGLFKLENGKVAINTANNELGKYFTADGNVVAMDGKTKSETIVELMKRFNTDTAQHSKIYEYVVRVGDVPESYKSSWVTEFVDAANDAYTVANGENGGTYGIAVSTYGVHIVYYSSKVEAQTFDFDSNWLATNKAEYRLFKAYYTTRSNEVLNDALEELKKAYYPEKITLPNKEFDKFLKENGLTFDFEKSLSLEEDKD